MAEVTELVTKFSFKGSVAPLTKYTAKLGSATKGLAKFATATFGTVGALNLWANSIFNSIDPIAQLNRETGVAVETIQKLGFAAEVNGGSVDGMNKSLKSLNQRIGEAVALGTGEGVAIFEKYGISLKTASGEAKTADKIFDELRQSIVKLDLDQRQVGSIANKLGLEPSAVQLLMKTNTEMESLNSEAEKYGILTQAQVDATADYNDALTRTKRAMTGVKQEIAVSFLPRMQKLTESFTKFIGENKELIKVVGKSVVTTIVNLSKAIGGVAKMMLSVIKNVAKTKTGLVILVGAVGLLVAAFAPITLTVILIAGLIFLVDDLITAFRGGESVIGGFVKKITLPDSIKKGWQWLLDLLNDMKTTVKTLFSLMGVKFPAQKQARDFSKPQRDQGHLDKMGAASVPQSTQSLWLDSLTNKSSPMQSSPITQNVNIDIKTTDPERAGLAVQESLQKQLSDTQAQFGNGGF